MARWRALAVGAWVAGCGGPSTPATPAPPEPAAAEAPAPAEPATPAPAPAPTPAPKTGPLLDLWTAWVAADCPEPAGDPLPVHARILRNVPYAREGYRFKDDALRAYFEQEPWYEGTQDAVEVEGAELSCVERLRTWEKARRKRAPNVPAHVEAAVLTQAARMTRMLLAQQLPTDEEPAGTLTERVEGDEDGTVRVIWYYEEPSPEPDIEISSSDMLICDPEGNCHTEAAG